MRKLVSLIAVAALAGGLALVVAAPAGASAAAKTSRFCKQLNKFDTSGLGNPTSEQSAQKYVKQLKKLEKSAKGSTKDAIGELVDAYERLADGDSAQDVFGNSDFANAAATFGLAIVKCGLSSIPDITLPDLPGS
jgi:hypothetical protein